jgi:antitoxin (DNA-binding transcriptional repressor) of toxin-antitoxin stability system
MRVVGLKVLKNRLSEYVRLAREGETVLVTDRDRVVAEINPPRPDRGGAVGDALLGEARRKGWIKAPDLVGSGPPPRAPVATLDVVLHELETDRAER